MYVTMLPCKILITALYVFTFTLCFKKVDLWQLTRFVEITKFAKCSDSQKQKRGNAKNVQPTVQMYTYTKCRLLSQFRESNFFKYTSDEHYLFTSNYWWA